jgi:hypothetical protein
MPEPRPGDVVPAPEHGPTHVKLVQPPVCPNGHPLPRPHWHLCDNGGHQSWVCDWCRAEIHAEHDCQGH